MTGHGRSPGQPCWFELGGPATDEALTFWGRELDWTFTANERVSGYHRAFADGAKVAGMGGAVHPRTPQGWRVYVHVDDVVETLSAARGQGAEVVVDVTEAGPDGLFAFIRDPFDVVTGFFQPHDDPGTAEPPGVGRAVDWLVSVADPEGFRAFHDALPYDLLAHASIESGRQGWVVVVESTTSGSLVDGAGNAIRLRSRGPSSPS